MDNVSYHSIKLNLTLSINLTKESIQKWLTEKNISFSSLKTKMELFGKVKAIKNKKRVYELDEEVHKAGHEMVRLPQYHCQYNPINIIWGQIKNKVESKNYKFEIAEVEKLTNEVIENITIDN